MKKTPLWKISIITHPEAEDAVSEFLGTLLREPATAYTDVETRLTTVTSYLSSKPDWRRVRTELIRGLANIKRCGLNTGPGKVALQKVRREDWAESWKRHFKAIEIGSALLIKPSWIKRAPRPGQAVVVLDPGLSFGTGQHPTTSFCLRQLVEHRFDSRTSIDEKKNSRQAKRQSDRRAAKSTLLDIGTGSGILAIAAAKLGYESIEAFDFDPEAVRVATENARKNRVANQLRLFQADLTRLPRRATKQFDVVCANLISTLLIAERERILNRLKPTGVLVIAGILAKEFGEVQRVFEKAGMKLIASRTEKEWRSGAFRFREKRALLKK
jgi:ribosomal protein L11 methyltransferase